MSTAQSLKAVATRTADDPKENILQGLLNRPFDADAWHAMDERDNALLRDEILHGAASRAFVYEFPMEGKSVTGVSVVGARELASQYKGIKSKIVATVEKRSAMFIFRTFTPLSIDVRTIHELEADDDFYECVVEVSDIKTGNSIEVRKKETRMEKKRDGSYFERKHYDVIAEAKAFRNGVLSVLPQSVIQDFKKRCLASGNSSTEQTIDQVRAGAMAHAAKNGIALNRAAVYELGYAEIMGLGAAAKESIEAFKRSAQALNLTGGADLTGGSASAPPPAPPPPPPAPEKKGGKAAKNASAPAAEPPAEAPGETEAPPPKKTYAQFADMILKAGSADDAAVFLDQARGVLNEDQFTDLVKCYKNKWETV